MGTRDQDRKIALTNDLLSRGECDWIEFKANNIRPDVIGVLASAISNSARLDGRASGYILWGIDDSSREVVGSEFDPSAEKVGNQGLEFWLAQNVSPGLSLRFDVADHPRGRVVLLEIPAAAVAPTNFKGVPHIRIGSATPKLTDHPHLFQRLIAALRPYSWESDFAVTYCAAEEVIALIDVVSYFRLTGQPIPPTLPEALERLLADRLISEDTSNKWCISNLGAILFALDLSKFSPSLARKSIRFVAYAGKNRTANVISRSDPRSGYALAFESLVSLINSLQPRNEHIGQALRVDRPLFPELAIRELVANALIHQDMTISGAGPQIEMFSDRIEISNPGEPLMQADRMIDLPPRSRNESLAALMRRMRFCEEQGSGLDKVIAQTELYQLPAPLFRANDASFQVVLYGPRKFAQMTADERLRACYHHAVLKVLSGDRLKNSSLCNRLGIAPANAAQASKVITAAVDAKLIRAADAAHPRSGYVPYWA